MVRGRDYTLPGHAVRAPALTGVASSTVRGAHAG